MPKINDSERKVKGPDYARVYERMGVVFSGRNGDDNVEAEACPYCGETRFFLNVVSGLYHCKKCEEKGNTPQFLTRMYEGLLAFTTDQHYQQLKMKRGIGIIGLKRHKLAYNPVEKCWLIPFKDRKGRVLTLQFYYPANGRKENLPGPTKLYNYDQFVEDKERIVLLCEGPFDAIALDHHIGSAYRKKYNILAAPGTFKDSWAELLEGYKVRGLYDNDKGGKAHSKRLRELLGESGVAKELRLLVWPKKFPVGCDINDLVRDYPEVKILGWSRKNSVKVVRQPKLIFYHGKQANKQQEIDWTWPDHLRCGTYVSFSGEQGTFKTSIMLDLCARYTKERKMPLCDSIGMPAGNVLYLFAEDDLMRVQSGFEQAGGDFKHWTCMPARSRDGDPLNILDHLGEMEQLIREKGIRLVVIDGQNSVVGSPNISTDMMARSNVTNKLHQFAQKLNICLVGIRNEDREGRAMGPQSMGDIARCVMRAVEKTKSDPPFCELKFVKVSDTARANYPTIPYSVKNLGGSDREILWGKVKPPSDAQKAIKKIAKGKK